MAHETCTNCGGTGDLEWVHDPVFYDPILVCGDCRAEQPSMIPIQ